MKILIRAFGLAFIAMIIVSGLIYLTNTSIIINELNDCSALAMRQTQEVMKQIIISDLDRNRIDLFKDIGYEDYYKKCFLEAVINPDLYELSVEGDDSKGILHVIIDVPKYKMIPQKELLHIIDVEGDGLDDLEALYYETTVSNKKTRVADSWNSFEPKVLLSLSSGDNSTRKYTGYSFTVDARNSTGDSRSIIGPYIELNCYKENGEKTLLQNAKGGENKESIIESDETCECSLLELSSPRGIDQSEFNIKTNVLELVRGSYYSEEVTTKVFKKDFKLSTVVDISMRYINDINRLSTKSIWLQDLNYLKVLEEYIGKLK